jgi:hypothetical protein
VSQPPALPLSESPNIRNLAKGCFGAELKRHRALPSGDVARGRERLPRVVYVAAAEREQAFATQATLDQLEQAVTGTDVPPAVGLNNNSWPRPADAGIYDTEKHGSRLKPSGIDR